MLACWVDNPESTSGRRRKGLQELTQMTPNPLEPSDAPEGSQKLRPTINSGPLDPEPVLPDRPCRADTPINERREDALQEDR